MGLRGSWEGLRWRWIALEASWQDLGASWDSLGAGERLKKKKTRKKMNKTVMPWLIVPLWDCCPEKEKKKINTINLSLDFLP